MRTPKLQAIAYKADGTHVDVAGHGQQSIFTAADEIGATSILFEYDTKKHVKSGGVWYYFG